MERIIKSTQGPGGLLNNRQRLQVKHINLNPEFNPKEKDWKLKKIMKSETRVIPWHIMYEDQNYVAMQLFYQGRGELVHIYKADNRGKLVEQQPILELRTYVDLEAACDKFVEFMEKQKLQETQLQ